MPRKKVELMIRNTAIWEALKTHLEMDGDESDQELFDHIVVGFANALMHQAVERMLGAKLKDLVTEDAVDHATNVA